MGRTRLLIERYGALGLLLLAMSAVTATIVASCGGGGDSSSTGALCQGNCCGPRPGTAGTMGTSPSREPLRARCSTPQTSQMR